MNREDPPDGWRATTLGDVITGFESGRSLGASGRGAEGDEIGVLKISAVTWGEFRPGENKALPAHHRARPQEFVRPGDLLITRANTTELVGAVALVPPDRLNGQPRLVLPDKILRIQPKSDVASREYLLYALRAPDVRAHFADNATGTSNSMRNLSQPKLAAAPILLPPLAEQHRIVERIGALFAEVNAARGRLTRVRGVLKRFRQSVLAAACSGRLTEEWRGGLGKSTSAGMNDDPDTAGTPQLPDIPATWAMVSLSAVTRDVQYGASVKASAGPEGVPILRMGNIQHGTLDLSELKYVPHSTASRLDDFLTKPGDVLFNRTNSPELVGKTAVVAETRPLLFASYLIRFRPREDRALSEYLTFWLNSPWGKSWARVVRTDGVSQSNINVAKLKRMPVPLPTLAEQRLIVDRVTQLFTSAAALDAQLTTAADRTAKLQRAILEKALSGELVPHPENTNRGHGMPLTTGAASEL